MRDRNTWLNATIIELADIAQAVLRGEISLSLRAVP